MPLPGPLGFWIPWHALGLAAVLAAPLHLGHGQSLGELRADRGLYDKHGLDVELWMPPPEFPGGIEIRTRQPTVPDIVVDGQTPMMVRHATDARFSRRIALAGGD